MKIVSLQPSVTVTLAGLGALDQVVGCTRYCKDVCPEVEQRVAHGDAQGERAILEDSWTADCAQIAALHPDVVIASVPYRLESLAEILRAGIRVVALAPKTLADVYGDIRLLAALVDAGDAGEELVSSLRDEIARTRETTVGCPAQRVYCEAWGKPLMASQAWVSEMVEASGGIPLVAAGAQTTAEAVAAMQPEVILAAWCGAGERVPLHKLAAREGWAQTEAVRRGRLYCVADELFNTPSHTLLGGLRAIRWALHRELFGRPVGIRGIEEEIG